MAAKLAKPKPKVWVGPAVVIKIMSPPPRNAVVALPIVHHGKVFGQLQSDPTTEAKALAMASLVNRALR